MAQTAQSEMILPSLFGDSANPYEIKPFNFFYSVVIHAAVMALMLYLATITVRVVNNPHASLNSILSTTLSLPPQLDRAAGGGGGGAHELLLASRGTPPKTSYEQVTPPTVHVAENPKLAVPPTVIVPDVNMARSASIGDLKGVLGPPSDGSGTGSGIGNGTGGGLGSGHGRGVGPGEGAGTGGGIYHVGGGVSQPRVIRQVEPEFSDEARKARFQGMVTVQAVIGVDGLVHDPKPLQALGMGLDEKALEALRQWRFEPAKKDGRPVPVYAILQVDFRLY